MKENHVRAMVDLVQRTLEVMFSVKARVSEVRQEDNREAPFNVSGIIGVAGPTRGTVVISFPADIAEILTSRMLNEEEFEDQDIGDCVGELANILAGNFLGHFEGKGATRSELSIPSVIMGRHRVVWKRQDVPYELMLFESDIGQFAVQVNFVSSVVAAAESSIEKVMIVDDSRVMRQVLKKKLREVGFDSCLYMEASDGKEALQRLEKEDYDVDLVFSDLWMPNMDGLQFIDALKENKVLDGGCHLVILTGDIRESQCAEALRRGACAVLSKPFTTDDVVKALDSVLEVSALGSSRSMRSETSM